jgi:cation transport ATPase
MAAAHASIAVASGTDLAVEVGDLTWHGGDLRELPAALEVARRAVSVIRSNLGLAAGYNLAGVAIAAAGLLHPVTAAVLMTCSSLLVTWRAAGREP